jgi:hypothetical protein
VFPSFDGDQAVLWPTTFQAQSLDQRSPEVSTRDHSVEKIFSVEKVLTFYVVSLN